MYFSLLEQNKVVSCYVKRIKGLFFNETAAGAASVGNYNTKLSIGIKQVDKGQIPTVISCCVNFFPWS